MENFIFVHWKKSLMKEKKKMKEWVMKVRQIRQ